MEPQHPNQSPPVWKSVLGKRVLVTGASSGIGKATAVRLADLGAKVILGGREEARLAVTMSEMRAGDHAISTFDLADVACIPEWLRGIANAHGPIDGVAHCAGVQRYMGLRQLEPASVESLLSMNVTASLMLLNGARRKDVRASGLSIVLVSSVMAFAGEAMQTVYCASKGAVVSLVRSAAVELAAERIRINAVAPGVVETPMTEAMFSRITESQIETVRMAHPLGFGKPSDVANAIAFLLGEESRWITGTTLVVDGGYLSR